MRLLLIEDTQDIGEAVCIRLRQLGHAVEWVDRGADAMSQLQHERFDLVILDLMLPDMDGAQILATRREAGDSTPFLVVTARSRIDDRVDVLDLGADDYLVKPFDLRELEARVRVLLRRGAGQADNRIRHGELIFDRSANQIFLNGTPFDLPNREFRLLEIFLSRPGQVLSKDILTDHLFGLSIDSPSPNAIEVYVGRLRRRLEGSGVEIRTLRGRGYVAEFPKGDGDGDADGDAP